VFICVVLLIPKRLDLLPSSPSSATPDKLFSVAGLAMSQAQLQALPVRAREDALLHDELRAARCLEDAAALAREADLPLAKLIGVSIGASDCWWEACAMSPATGMGWA
jgi:hypothetical protein